MRVPPNRSFSGHHEHEGWWAQIAIFSGFWHESSPSGGPFFGHLAWELGRYMGGSSPVPRTAPAGRSIYCTKKARLRYGVSEIDREHTRSSTTPRWYLFISIIGQYTISIEQTLIHILPFFITQLSYLSQPSRHLGANRDERLTRIWSFEWARPQLEG